MDTLNSRTQLKSLGNAPICLDSEVFITNFLLVTIIKSVLQSNPTSIRLQNQDKTQDSSVSRSAQVQQASTSETSEKMFEKKYSDTEDAYAHLRNAV